MARCGAGAPICSATTKEWHGLRASTPYRLGTESDWSRILSGMGRLYAWKRSGHAWISHERHDSETNSQKTELEPGTVIKRMSSFDNINWRSLARYMNSEVGVREDGTLWAWNYMQFAGTKLHEDFSAKIVQIGKDTDWTAVAGEFTELAAIKADGSLWKWELSNRSRSLREEEVDFLTKGPVRLGIHTDWIAVGQRDGRNRVLGGPMAVFGIGGIETTLTILPCSQLQEKPVKIETSLPGRNDLESILMRLLRNPRCCPSNGRAIALAIANAFSSPPFSAKKDIPPNQRGLVWTWLVASRSA